MSALVNRSSASVSPSSVVNMIDTYDRKPEAYEENKYARSGEYCNGFSNEPGKRIPKVGVYAEVGVGRARAECSVFDAEAKLPNASAGAELSLTGAKALAQAELGSVSATAGPVKAQLGLGVDTGASIGIDGVEVKILGCGFSVGPRISLSLLGSGLTIRLW
ncbi:hypothetical protein FKM82_029220 [Ascaphus truei]